MSKACAALPLEEGGTGVRETADELFLMTDLFPATTGLPMVIWVGPSYSTNGGSGAIRPGLTRAGMAQSGRVGVWRGGSRPGMSVTAPFVWRCLSGATIAPFPYPSHRTGHADFPASGSRTRPHAFTHGTSRPSRVRRTSPKVS